MKFAARAYKYGPKVFRTFQKLSLVCLISASARHKGRKFTIMAKNQWFLRWPLPLVEWYLLNHWDQWFFDGFSVSQPLVTMFFNGCQPLVQLCDGNDTSLRSSLNDWTRSTKTFLHSWLKHIAIWLLGILYEKFTFKNWEYLRTWFSV